MTIYDLHLESGPKKRKTMVHVLDLLGCIAVGPTSDDAVANTPEAIEAYLRFLKRIGENVDPEAQFETKVVEHITEGEWLGNGSPYLTFEADLKPVTATEIDRYLQRSAAMVETLAIWADGQTESALAGKPAESGREARSILLHVLGTQHVYFSSALGGAKGFGPIHTAAERGDLPLAVALRETVPMVDDLIRSTTSEQRSAVRELTSRTYTLRKAFRRQLEHTWEHLAELSRRPGGPEL